MSSLQYIFLLLGLVAVSVRHVRALSEEEKAAMRKEFEPIVMECTAKFGTTEEEVIKAEAEGRRDSLDPCLFGCFGKKIGIINDKGEFDVEGAKELLQKFLTNEEERNKAIEILEKCSSVNDLPVSDDKGCERGALLHVCLHEHKDQLF